MNSLLFVGSACLLLFRSLIGIAVKSKRIILEDLNYFFIFFLCNYHKRNWDWERTGVKNWRFWILSGGFKKKNNV